MIPKIIHYCWFGRGEMPLLAEKCIDSWHKYMPDYEYRLWNEDSFDVKRSTPYVKEAYEAKKYAFVSDYVRLWALNEFGGIYLDTDVELLKSFDDLLSNDGFICYEIASDIRIETSVIGCEKGNSFIKEILKKYEDRRFLVGVGEYDMESNTSFITRVLREEGLKIDGEFQGYKGMHIYPAEYFAPLTSTRVLNVTENTYCIHHFAGSWEDETCERKIKNFIAEKVLGRVLTDRIVRLKRKFMQKIK